MSPSLTMRMPTTCAVNVIGRQFDFNTRELGTVALAPRRRAHLLERVLQYITNIEELLLGDRSGPIVVQYVEEVIRLERRDLGDLIHSICLLHEGLEGGPRDLAVAIRYQSERGLQSSDPRLVACYQSCFEVREVSLVDHGQDQLDEEEHRDEDVDEEKDARASGIRVRRQHLVRIIGRRRDEPRRINTDTEPVEELVDRRAGPVVHIVIIKGDRGEPAEDAHAQC